MPDNKQKTKVYTNKKEFDKANQAYQDSLNLYNQSEKAKELFIKDKDGSSLEERLKLSDQSENITNRTKDEPVYRYFKNFRNPNTLDRVKYFNDFPEEDNVVGFKKPTIKPIYEEIKPKPKIEPIKPLGIKPMNTSVEPKLADKKQEIIQEPMNKKQTYTASPNLKKMGKSTGREYVDGQWIETKSKGGTVKKYAVGGMDLSAILKNIKPDDVKTVLGALPSPGSAPQQTSQDPNAPKKKNIGKIVGSVVGGVAGSVIAPGVGTMIGSTIGGGIGGAIDNKTYKNKVEDYNATVVANKSSQQNAMTSNIAGNFNPNAQGKQFKKGGELIKRADGSYSKRGLWDNIRANKGSGKAPTKEMLEQERKIKKMAEGGIHIKESKKGTFTAAASKHGKSVQGFASQVLANKENYSPAMVKKANFARNAAKWHHAMGGIDTSNSMSGPKYAKGGFDANNPAMGNTTQYAPDAEFFTNSEAPASANNFAVDYGSKRSPAQTQTQAKQKPAINVTDPNDPRLKAYNDSLALYNDYNRVKNILDKQYSSSDYIKEQIDFPKNPDGSICYNCIKKEAERKNQVGNFINNLYGKVQQLANPNINPTGYINYLKNNLFFDESQGKIYNYSNVEPVQPYKLVSPSITNKPTTPKSNNLVKPAPRETLSKMPISPIKKLDTNSIQAQPNLQTKEIPTTPSSNIKDQRTYTASKMLEKMGRPAGYINEGMNEGRQEITKSKGGVVKKYVKGGMLKPMGNDMYEVKSYKKGTDKVEYRPNVFIDNKEIIRKNSDGSTQILSDDLGYAKVAKNIARAKGGNITDEQFDQLYMNQEMSKASKGKSNKYVEGGTDKKLKLRNPMSDDRATLVSGNFDSFGAGKPVSGSIDAGYSPDKFNIDPEKGLTVKPFTYKTPGSLGYDTPKKQPGAFDVKTPEVDLKASKFIGETKGKYGYNSQVPEDNKSLDTKVNPLGYLSTLPSAAYDIGLGLKGADPVDFERMNTKYQFADPRGAMAAASRGVTSAYNAAKNAAKTTTTSAGEYLANMGNLASKEGMEKASALTAIKAQYDMANTQGLNQTNLNKDQFNAQVQMRESIARQEEQDAARSSISKGLAGLSQNTMSYMSDVNANKTQRRFVDLINSGEYEYVEEIDADGKPRIKLVPKKGAKSDSVQITPSPTKQTEPAKAKPAKK